MFNPAQDWPAYILICLFFGIVFYLVKAGKRSENKEKEDKDSKN